MLPCAEGSHFWRESLCSIIRVMWVLGMTSVLCTVLSSQPAGPRRNAVAHQLQEVQPAVGCNLQLAAPLGMGFGSPKNWIPGLVVWTAISASFVLESWHRDFDVLCDGRRIAPGACTPRTSLLQGWRDPKCGTAVSGFDGTVEVCASLGRPCYWCACGLLTCVCERGCGLC